MAISASSVTPSNSLEEFRIEFNNLVTDVTGITSTNTFSTAIVFEGATADDYETTLTLTDPTADRTITLPNVTGNVTVSGNPVSADGEALGSTTLEWSDLYLADGSVIYFGADQDITLTHTADTGLTTNGTLQATTITATTALVPDASDGATLGTNALEWSDLFLADGALINWGDDQDVSLKHVADVGLTLTNTNTGDNLPVVFQLKSEEDAIIANEVIASLEFAAGDSDGTDAATVAAGIHAIAEDTFSASANATKLVFTTGVSETAAASATAKMTLSSAGALDIVGDVTAANFQPDGDTAAGDSAAIGYTSTEGLILTGQGSSYDVTLKNDADGTVAGIITGTTDLRFPDSSKATFGAGGDLQIYHDGSNSYISDQGTGNLTIMASQINMVNAAGGETLAQFNPDGAVELFYDNTSALATKSGGGTLTGTWEVTTALVPDASDGAALGTTALEWSDLYLADGAVIYFGDDQDVTLTHAADTSLTLNLMMAATTFEPSGDTASGDNAAIGYTSAEGLILTGQGSTSDITLKNDADGTVFTVPTGTDDILFPDNAKAMWGAGSDLQIYHDGSNSYINDAGTGNLKIAANQIDLLGGTDGGETMASFVDNGAVTLYYDNSAVAATADGSLGPTSANGAALGGTSTEWSDLYLHDGAIIYFGADQDVTLTHVADAGLLLNSTMQLQFNDASQYISGASATKMDIRATDEIELTSTLVDIVGALTVSGTTTLNGALVLGDAAADTLTVNATLQGASPLTFEGGTADGYETTFAITDPTADRTITFPNKTMTVAGLDDVTALAIALG